ncbi:MAG: hypothetical protein AAGI38_01820 [Bacteroidota bacterium]
MKRLPTFLYYLLFSWQLMAQYPGTYPTSGGQASGQEPHDGSGYYGETYQVALLLDVSGSMDGLIEQAKSQLWYIVNDIYTLSGSNPRIELALYEYGNSRLGAQRGYLRQVTPFTQDFDWVSDELFRLRTGGSAEYCGMVIEHATFNLRWDNRYETRKLMYIAGNESFSQGRVSYQRAIEAARNRGIQMNTIFCGNASTGRRLGWENAAFTAGGLFSNIDHNQRYFHSGNSYDRQLSQLNQQLNQTYVPYGSQGSNYYRRQQAQDRYAQQYGTGNLGQRAMVKASPNYRNESWDLVDAVSAGQVNLADVPSTDLPVEMRSMSFPQREAYVQQKKQERETLKRKIQQTAQLSRQTEQTKPSSASKPALENAIKQSLVPANTRRPVRSPTTFTPKQQTAPKSQPSSNTRSSGSFEWPSNRSSGVKQPRLSSPGQAPTQQTTRPAPRTTPSRSTPTRSAPQSSPTRSYTPRSVPKSTSPRTYKPRTVPQNVKPKPQTKPSYQKPSARTVKQAPVRRSVPKVQESRSFSMPKKN